MRGPRIRRGSIAIAAAVALLLSAVPATAAPPHNDWHVTARLALGVDDTAVSCAGSRCWTLEAGELLESNDGGATWSSQTASVPAGIAALNDVDCPRASVCYFLATTDAQQSVVLIERHGELTVHDVAATTTWVAISCAGPQHCVATDGFSSFATRNSWDSYFTRPFAQALYGSADIGCTPGTNTCAAVGDFGETPRIEYTANDGETWTPQTVPSPSDGMYAVACPTTKVCYAGGADFSDHTIILRTTDHGAHWNFASLSAFQPYPVRSISCLTETTCFAVGDTPGNSPFVFATTDGANWTRQSIDAIGSEQRAQVSCASALQCAIVEGGTAFGTGDGGATWTPQSIPAAIETPREMACSSTTHCVGITSDATGVAQTIVSDDGGTTWEPHAFPPGTGAPMDIVCPALAVCLATTLAPADGGPPVSQIWRSGDGGVTWQAGHVQHPRGSLGRLACATATTCLAVGADSHSHPIAEATTDGGSHWNEIGTPTGIDGIEGVACSAIDACVLIGETINAAPQAFTTTDLGASYDPHALPNADGNSYFLDVDCARRTCIATGSVGGSMLIERSSDEGATWKAGTLTQSIDSPEYVDCVSPVHCALTAFDFDFDTGGPVVAMTNNGGRTWRVEPIPARREQPLSLACHATGCIASDVSAAGNPIILAGAF